MNLTIITCEHREEWDSFFVRCAPPTFLQTWEWLEVNRAQGHETFPLVVTDGSAWQAIALVTEIRAKRSSYLLCAHGPIFAPNVDQETVFKALTSHLEQLAKSRSCDFIRLCPLTRASSNAASLFATLRYRPAPIHQTTELAWMIDLQKSEEELLQEMRKSTRYAIKHSEKDGITVEMSVRIEDLDRFLTVYQETVDRQNFHAFPRSYFETEFKAFNAHDSVRFFFGVYQGETISTAMVLYTKNSAFYHHGASSHRFAKVNASSSVQWEAVKEAKRRGCTSYNFWGIAPPDQPKHPWVGLTTFKTGFGGVSEAYLHAQDKPITFKYWLNYIIEKMRAKRRGFKY